MNNKKNNFFYIGMWILLIIILILVIYIICYKVLNDKNKQIDNNMPQKGNQSINKDDYDKEQPKCDESICAHKYMYKIKITNKNGALIYDSYKKSVQNVIETIGTGKEIEVFGDFVDTTELNTSPLQHEHIKFDEIKNYYYFAIDLCCERKYIKYSDAEIIESSIIATEKFETTKKIYIHHDTFLYSGPALYFQKKDNDKKISKGTILEVNVYNRIDAAKWFYVNYNGKHGWILEDYFTSVDYPYNEVAWGSAVLLDETKGEFYLENEENLYKYAFSSDNVISKIPKGTKISYDYVTGETGVDYYHINYNGNSGWIEIDW